MSKEIRGDHKHLTLSDRVYIEQALTRGDNFRTIAKTLGKDPSTISLEVRRFLEWNDGYLAGQLRHVRTAVFVHNSPCGISNVAQGNHQATVCFTVSQESHLCRVLLQLRREVSLSSDLSSPRRVAVSPLRHWILATLKELSVHAVWLISLINVPDDLYIQFSSSAKWRSLSGGEPLHQVMGITRPFFRVPPKNFFGIKKEPVRRQNELA